MTRRSRPPSPSARSRKSRTTEPPQTLGQGHMSAPVIPVHGSLDVLASARPDPTETAQLRALEAGWDELL